MITVVDSSHFLELDASKDHIKTNPDLVFTETLKEESRKSHASTEVHIHTDRRVVDLLVEMLECADCVILNKSDRISPARLQQLR